MKISIFNTNKSDDVINLFTRVFSDAEGKDEGESIGGLVSELINTTDHKDIIGFVAAIEDEIVGCIFFSRLALPSEKEAFILSPVAIATELQGKGIGQQLIKHGIEYLASKNVELVFTYGDPAYYSKVGFRQINESIVKAPVTLTQPEGWLAQSLTGNDIETEHGISKCVKALDNPKYW